MFDLKKERFKKRLFLGCTIVFGLIFLATAAAVIFWDVNPLKTIPPAFLVFIIFYTLYQNSKKAIAENTRESTTSSEPAEQVDGE